MSRGYCLAHRQAWTHEAFKDLREASVWNFLYQNAFWEDGERLFNGRFFQLKRGQIVVSISFLSNGFHMSERSIRTLLKTLNKLRMIDMQTTNKATIITICNYNEFQPLVKTDDKQNADKRQTKCDNNNEINKLINIFLLRAGIEKELWDDFMAERKRLKASNSDRALKLLMSEIEKLQAKGHDPTELINQSILKGWKSVFAPYETKGTTNGNHRKSRTQDLAEQANRMLDELGQGGTC